nr:unnamed protein product [Digitaria exilis]
MWEQLQLNDDSQSVSEFDISKLESLFPAVVRKSERTKSLGSKPEKVRLCKVSRMQLFYNLSLYLLYYDISSEQIELRRANNAEIMLTKVKLQLSDLVSTALSLFQSSLDVVQVENLIKFCPTKEEMELLKNYTGDKDNLGKCEQVLAARSPQLLNFYVDLVSLDAASMIQVKMLAEEMYAVSKGLEKVQMEYEASERDGPVSEIFREKLKEFTGSVGAEVQSLSSLFSEVSKKIDALIKYFGEDPVRCCFEQVISTLLTFVTNFRKAHAENLRQVEFEKKKTEKEEAEKYVSLTYKH